MSLLSGLYTVALALGGGKAGSDFSILDSLDRWLVVLLPVFLRRRAISASWQSMQNMPCDVLAYLRFSIFLLQFRHLKQLAQKAWSPVRIARSSILFPQPATAVRAVVANQGAIAEQEEVRIGVEQGVAGITPEAVDVPSVSGLISSVNAHGVHWNHTHQVQTLCPPPKSVFTQHESTSQIRKTNLSATLARICRFL